MRRGDKGGLVSIEPPDLSPIVKIFIEIIGNGEGKETKAKRLRIAVFLLHISCILASQGCYVNVGLVESKRKSRKSYIWLVSMGLMMAKDTE